MKKKSKTKDAKQTEVTKEDKKMKENKKWIITSEVYDEICNTIGVRKPEWGGILGSSDGIHIDHYYFDVNAKRSATVYSMNVDDLNRVIHNWNDNEDTRLVGIIHSHPDGVTRPSAGDMKTVSEIIDSVDVDDEFFTPIVQVSPELNGEITIYPFTFKKSLVCQEQYVEIDKTSPEEKEKRKREELANQVPNRTARIESILPSSIMGRKTVIVVGCGGSRGFIESLARCGVGKFVLFDGDQAEDTNIATQGIFASEVGRYKVDVIKKSIYDINPLAHVVGVKHNLDDEITDNDFAQVTGIKTKKTADVLICGCTDNFNAQDRCAQLSIKYGVPYLAAQIFPHGIGHEVLFWYPGLTKSCPRCMMETRYKKILKENEEPSGSSAGAAICVTDYLNSIKEYMALNILCYKDEKTAYYNNLNSYADRNYLMTKCSEELKAPAFVSVGKLSEQETDLSFPFVTIAIGQTPEEKCPLCHGNPDDMKGKIKDTRIIADPYSKDEERK